MSKKLSKKARIKRLERTAMASIRADDDLARRIKDLNRRSLAAAEAIWDVDRRLRTYLEQPEEPNHTPFREEEYTDGIPMPHETQQSTTTEARERELDLNASQGA